MASVHGYCPMGCGKTLSLGAGGYVTCSLIGCPNPTGADQLLDTWETEHVVVFSEEQRFTILHPLRERIDGELFDCELHAYLVAIRDVPVAEGRYRVIKRDEQWTFQRVPS